MMESNVVREAQWQMEGNQWSYVSTATMNEDVKTPSHVLSPPLKEEHTGLGKKKASVRSLEFEPTEMSFFNIQPKGQIVVHLNTPSFTEAYLFHSSAS